MKKFIGILMAFAIAFCSLSLLSVDAKVIEPEIVKTEKWTTSYWIDDDKDTVYPYIDCEADIYNDGSVKVYAWNTHEFDGFATVTNHKITLVELAPVSYSLYKDGLIYATEYPYEDNVLYKKEEIVPFKMNYYPDDYAGDISYINDYRIGTFSTKYRVRQNKNGVYHNLRGFRFNGALSTLPFSDKRKECVGNFRPQVEPTGTYNFRILGHEFTITPDLLQTTQIPEPPVTDDTDSLKARIAELEATIDMYETLLTSVSLERGDVNNDGFINAVDASQILSYYAYTSTGGHLDFMDFLEGKVDKEES